MPAREERRWIRPGRGARLLPAVLLLSMSCTLLGQGAARTAETLPAEVLSPTQPIPLTSTPLTPAYVPAECQGIPLATVGPALAGATPVPEANPPLTADEQQAVAEELIRAVEDVYVAPERLGSEWQAAGEVLRQHIAEGLDTEDFYTELQQLISGLGDEHSQIESPVEVAASDAALSGIAGSVGIGVLVKGIPESGVITLLQVYDGSPASKAGLEPHDNLVAVDGAPLVQGGVPLPWLVRGPECSLAVVTVASPGEPPREVAMVRHRYSVEQAIDARLLSAPDGGRIGYLFLPSFYDERIPGQVEEALQEFGPLDGLVIDNRMNGGGSSIVFEPMLSLFTSGKVGEFVSRAETRPLEITPREVQASQSVPLVVLIGEHTVSFGEIFAGVLRDDGRARLVGQTTAGNVETLHGYYFDDGSRLWIAEERFVPAVSLAGWEGIGVQPDVEVVALWHTYSVEDDPVLAAALQLLAGE